MGVDIEAMAGLEFSLGEKDKKDLTRIFKDSVPREEKKIYRMMNSQATDASGNLDLEVGMCPEGWQFDITSLLQWMDGKTPATVFTNAASWYAYYINYPPNAANLMDIGPGAVSGTIFPLRLTYADLADPLIPGGDSLWFHLVGAGAIANTNVTVIASGFLRKC